MSNNDTLQGAVKAIAESDTPEAVNVPQDKISLIIWAVGRFGIGAVFAYAAYLIYGDMKASNERFIAQQAQQAEKILEVFNQSIRTQIEFKSALDSNTRVMEDLKYRLNIKPQ